MTPLLRSIAVFVLILCGPFLADAGLIVTVDDTIITEDYTMPPLHYDAKSDTTWSYTLMGQPTTSAIGYNLSVTNSGMMFSNEFHFTIFKLIDPISQGASAEVNNHMAGGGTIADFPFSHQALSLPNRPVDPDSDGITEMITASIAYVDPGGSLEDQYAQAQGNLFNLGPNLAEGYTIEPGGASSYGYSENPPYETIPQPGPDGWNWLQVDIYFSLTGGGPNGGNNAHMNGASEIYVTPVPVPPCVGLLGSGLLFLAGLRKRWSF